MGTAFPHVAISAYNRKLAGGHHIGCPLDAVNEGLTATVEIIELALGDAVVHVDGGDQQIAFRAHFIEAVDTGGRLFRHPFPLFCDPMPSCRISFSNFLQN